MENSPFKTKNSYTIEQKIFILNLLNQGKSKHEIEKEFGITRKTLRDWQEIEEDLRKMINKKDRNNLPGAGRPSQTKDIENNILEWIYQLRDQGVALTTHEIINYTLTLNPEMKNKSYHALVLWCFRFMKRNSLTIRIPTHIGQILRDNAYNQLNDFLRIIINTRKDLNICENLESIGNTDETPIWFEFFAKKTIARIGEKNINVRTFGSEKSRITVLLTILANGVKLPPLIVFKGKKNGTIFNRLKKHPAISKGKVFVQCQENSWVDSSIFYEFLNNIWFAPSLIKPIGKTLLVMDRARSHFSNEISDIFEKNNSKFILIPPGMTRFVQPLDVCINKPFKDAMRKAYTEYEIKKGMQNKPSHEDLVSRLENVWYDPNLLTSEMIKKSFKICGISNSLDGSEDNFFKWPKEINPSDLNEIENDSNYNQINLDEPVEMENED